MNKIAKIGQPAPELEISSWAQGKPTSFAELSGNVILIEVFQVNCPGCFLYSLPRAIDLHQRYHDKGLSVIGLATAFEDFDKNTLQNLSLLLEQNIVIGETQRMLLQQNRLIDGRLPFHIPFSVAMDKISNQQQEISENDISAFIKQHIADYKQQDQQQQQHIQQQVLAYLQSQLHRGETFSKYALQGTPSHLVVDKRGNLKASEFGDFAEIEWLLTSLLEE